MNILTTNTTPQEVKIIPRDYIEDVDVYIQDENTKVITSFSDTTTFDNGSMVITNTFNLTEGSFYIMEVKDGLNLLFRGRIFCTDQVEFSKYDMIQNEFTSSNDTSEIIYI